MSFQRRQGDIRGRAWWSNELSGERPVKSPAGGRLADTESKAPPIPQSLDGALGPKEQANPVVECIACFAPLP